MIRAAVFAWRDLGLSADPRIPPDPFGLGAVRGEKDFKPSLTVIAGLLPGALPQTIGDHDGGETTAVLTVGAVPLSVQRCSVAFVIFDFEDFPLSAEIRQGRGPNLAGRTV